MIILKHFSLRIAIQTIFIATFIALMTVVIFLSTNKFSESISYYSKLLMEKTVINVIQEFSKELGPAHSFSQLTQTLFEKDIITPQEMINYTYYIAKNLPHYKLNYPVRVAAWGDEVGNSVVTYLETDGTYSTSLIMPYATPPISLKYFRDPHGNIIRNKTISKNYDPRKRPWYVIANESNKPVWTDVFYSYPYRNLTIAPSVAVFNHQQKKLGVFEIELKLIGLSNYLSSIKISPNSQIFILNGKNELTVYPGMEKELSEGSEVKRTNALIAKGKAWQVRAIDTYDVIHQDYFKYYFNNETYLAYFKTIPGIGNHGLKIGIVVPENDFMGDLKRASLLVQLISVGVLCVGILLIRIFSNFITKPLKIIIEDTKKIKQFHLDTSKTIKSHVTEIIVLAEAMQSMKSNLKSFQKYVPTDLVRQLIQSGEDARLGGTKRNLTAFFSDIRNFTDISENMEAEALMAHLCEYFEELSKIILREKGTIDKYIGDAIMAFWGAPLEDETHCINACYAALKCKNRLDELNALWEKQNKPKLITGIGIHTGAAIVGNIGSNSRLNYTAVGDTINTASRIENLSKVYGSVIAVSEAVVQAAQEHFNFRFIEQVTIRGKTGTYNIYELVSVKEVET